MAIENRPRNSSSRTVWKVDNKNIVVVVDDNSDLLIGVRVQVTSSEHAHEIFRPANLQRVLSTENSCSSVVVLVLQSEER